VPGHAGRLTGVLVYHVVPADEWADAASSGDAYRGSTRGRSLDDEGFIHCSFADQVATTAERVYGDRDDLAVLTVDTDRVDSEVRVENGYPHIYGPLPIDAVIAVERL
jgi:uncharacterized protein (DUF952 family)